MKKFLKSERVQRALAALIVGYIRTIYALTRWTRVNVEAVDARALAGQPMIVCFWHGRMAVMPNFWTYPMKMFLLGSPHRDAQLMRFVVGHFGMTGIVGSSTRGGARAAREMVHVLRDGAAVCVTPDGPRGPRMRAAAGITAIARLSGAPIFPCAYSTTRGKVLNTWDRLLLPYPFGRGALVVGEPVIVAADADAAAVDAARIELENRLNAVTAEADRLCGRAPVEPAPMAAAS